MKKIASLLIAMVLLFAVQPFAFAENGFLSVANFLLSDEMLGTEHAALYGEDEIPCEPGFVMLRFLLTEQTLTESGYDNEGNGETIVFTECDSGELLAYSYMFCKNWDTIADQMDEGYSFVILVYISADQAPYVIMTEEKAEEYCTQLEALIAANESETAE